MKNVGCHTLDKERERNIDESVQEMGFIFYGHKVNRRRTCWNKSAWDGRVREGKEYRRERERTTSMTTWSRRDCLARRRYNGLFTGD